jgi:hypothetical protein
LSLKGFALFARAGFFYGDAAIIVRRAAFEAMGGFKPLPRMEDFEGSGRHAPPRRAKVVCHLGMDAKVDFVRPQRP